MMLASGKLQDGSFSSALTRPAVCRGVYTLVLHCGSIRQAMQVMSMVELDARNMQGAGYRADDALNLGPAAMQSAITAAAVLQHCSGAG